MDGLLSADRKNKEISKAHEHVFVREEKQGVNASNGHISI